MAKIMKDGKPSTSFSRQDREWVKAMGGGSGGNITVEALNVTENGTYTAEEGKAYSPVTVNVAGGEATIESIEVTNVLPNGKTLHHFDYFVYLDEEGNSIECIAVNSLAFPFVSGQPTYIEINSGASTDGAYMRASNIVVTGNIEADGEYLTISGEGTVTITWVIA